MAKTTIKLILIYFGIQIGVTFPIFLVWTLISLLQGNDAATGMISIMGICLLFSNLLMGYYLYKKRYFGLDRQTWSFKSPLKMILLCIALVVSYNILFDLFSTYVPLPNLFSDTFADLSTSILGILIVVFIGPVLEELLFRGTFIPLFLRNMEPWKAILLSALIFGIIHGNPVQVINAFFIGLLLGWLYYKTASLIPVILIHILNNGFSMFLMKYFADVDSVKELVGPASYRYWVLGGALLFMICLLFIFKIKEVDWKSIPEPGIYRKQPPVMKPDENLN